jgi:hypothetical protein
MENMAKAKPKAQFKIQINEESWTCRLWPVKTYIKLHGNDSDAITDLLDRTMDFKDDALTLENVAHEAMHAHFKYLHLDSVVNPKIDDIEEIIASWIGSNFEKFYHRVNLIYKELSNKEKS